MGSLRTQLSFSEYSSTTLLSGSTDGLVNVFNTAIGDEDDALLQVANHGASIHHAGFAASTFSNSRSSADMPDAFLYALSHDETMSIYPRIDSDSGKEDMNEAEYDAGGEETANFGDLRQKLHCDYVVDILPTPNNLILAAGSQR